MRPHALFVMMLITLTASFKAEAMIGVCGFYRATYKEEIRPKIEAGIPFELMSVVVEADQLVSKKAIRISYNLWDEILTINSGGQTLGRLPLTKAEDELCKFLEISDELKPGHVYKFKVLLNPMWAERMTRLQVASNQTGQSNRLMQINWQKLAGEMPSEKTLLEKEFKP